MQESEIEQYWQSYLATILSAIARTESYEVQQFGDSPALATVLGNLILEGVKTVTCSAVWEWDAEGRELPHVGAKTIVLDGDHRPLCMIETVEITIQTFSEVDAHFAHDEGEGDRSLESWRTGHWQYFARVLPLIGKQPDPHMQLVCERFRVIYPV